jgi:hypothetical protein
LATVISSLINTQLKGTKLKPHDTFLTMRELDIDIHEATKIINAPIKCEKEIISLLNLKSPFEIDAHDGRAGFLAPVFSPLASRNQKPAAPKAPKTDRKKSPVARRARPRTRQKKI